MAYDQERADEQQIHKELMERIWKHVPEVWEASEAAAEWIAGEFVDAQAKALALARAELRRALGHIAGTAPTDCRYHGRDFERSGMRYGLPRCETCQPPFLRQERLNGGTETLAKISRLLKEDEEG